MNAETNKGAWTKWSDANHAAVEAAEALAPCSALRWAVFPCGWKWEIASLTRENETPVALFEHKHHAESFCREWWPALGEVRPLPNTKSSRGTAQP